MRRNPLGVVEALDPRRARGELGVVEGREVGSVRVGPAALGSPGRSLGEEGDAVRVGVGAAGLDHGGGAVGFDRVGGYGPLGLGAEVSEEVV